MNRARATALDLVNWKGVFFERYALDRHVTALEGANGAGKTTVMIAAYVVLLPDLTRLKFVNVGESGATGGDRGIWGRLGEAGPSYAVLEIDVAGERLLAGVHLERKAAPALTLTPFLVTGLPHELSPERFLLSQDGAFEQVPPLRELERQVGAAGGQMEVFGSAKDYFARLFERGVTPLRLSSDEERNKFSEMLRTSMTGGISRTLTNDLRSFLFKQDHGLHDTLSRMRQSLESCRRTRLEVSEARRLEQEIGGVHAAAQAMFLAAFGALRAEAAESRARLEQAERALTEAAERAAELETMLREAELERVALIQSIEQAELGLSTLREHFERRERRASAQRRLEQAEAECARLRDGEARATEQREHARALRAGAKREQRAAQEAFARTLEGLSSLETGLTELERKAHEHRRVQTERARALERIADYGAERRDGEPELGPVRALLGAMAASAEAVGAPPEARDVELAVLELHEARKALETLRAERRRRTETAARALREQGEALTALESLLGKIPVEDAAASARGELARLNELELLAGSAEELLVEYQHRAALARRRSELSRQVEALGLPSALTSAQLSTELEALERRWRALDAEQREVDAASACHAVEGELVRAKLENARALAAPYRRVAAAAARLGARGLHVPASPEAASELLASMDARYRDVLEQREQLVQRRAALQKLAPDAEGAASGHDAELALLAERMEGELLMARHQELDEEAARRKEAELGPLLEAIVVDDPWRAFGVLAEAPPARDHVYLVRPGAWPAPAAAAHVPADYALVDLGYGLRLSRLPQHPTLGRAARRERALALRAELERSAGELEASERSARELAAARRDLEALSDQLQLWVSGDPERIIAELEGKVREADARRADAQARARELRLESAALGVRLATARPLLAHAHLLDTSEQELAEHAARASQTLARSRGARAELERVRRARQTLLAHLHRLEEPAAGPRELEQLEADRERLDAQQDRLFSIGEAIAVLAANSAAWAWAHAEQALATQNELAPALRLERERAETAVASAEAATEAAESLWEAATLEAQRVSAELAAHSAHAERARAELTADGGDAEWSNEEATLALEQTRAELERARERERALEAALLLGKERLAEARRREQAASAAAGAERERSEPARRLFVELEARAMESGAPLPPDDPGSRGSSELWLEARAKRDLLADRLAAGRGYTELASALGERDDLDFLGLWLEVQQALTARLPHSLSELGRAGAGLERLRADLLELELRLGRQEGDLRGTSADVAHSIDVQTRRAAAQVKRLNAALSGTGFGSIHAIRIQLERVAKMDQVLRALREGETQELLFQSNLPIEAALDEIFKRHAGGRSGGQRLLDYREYLELEVAIQRKPDDAWVRVNPSQVSTGEAIGIGAALMMVILAEWERDDQLLRRPQQLGSLRFLFLDEANRLSQDNLGVLFELCERLDLQLLIAAPEVALSAGNTTYRLVRRVHADGREEVIVSGRRASLPVTNGGRDPAGPPEKAAQAELFSPR